MQQQPLWPAAGLWSTTSKAGRLQRPQSRGGNDLANREAALQAYAQQSYNEQRLQLRNVADSPIRVVEGVSRPLWLGDRLLLARRVQIGEQTVDPGLLARLGGAQGAAAGRSGRSVAAGRADAGDRRGADQAQPAAGDAARAAFRAAAGSRAGRPGRRSACRWSSAWACLLVTALAAAMMLHSVITLSERRGAFVSAVTHELRTPLTTFRMYAEMLAGGMVPDAEPAAAISGHAADRSRPAGAPGRKRAAICPPRARPARQAPRRGLAGRACSIAASRGWPTGPRRPR